VIGKIPAVIGKIPDLRSPAATILVGVAGFLTACGALAIRTKLAPVAKVSPRLRKWMWAMIGLTGTLGLYIIVSGFVRLVSN